MKILYIVGSLIVILLLVVGWGFKEIITTEVLRSACVEKIESKGKTVDIFLVPGQFLDVAYQLKSDLERLDVVQSAVVISADERLENFRLKHSDDQLIIKALDELGGNALEHHIVVHFNNFDDKIGISRDKMQKVIKEGNIKVSKINISTVTPKSIQFILKEYSSLLGVIRHVDKNSKILYESLERCSRPSL